MNLAVKLYQNVALEDKPNGIPDLWPAEVIELGDKTDLPDGYWSLMTFQEYQDYRTYHKPAYDSWYNNLQTL